jgi:NhaA family Na+:H+ antiporter
MTHPARPRLLDDERVSGALLLLAAIAALVVANSSASGWYDGLLDTTIGPKAWHLDLSVHAWVTEGLLALFFFVVGTELARELRVGALRDWRRASLPVIAAVGGMAMPALVFTVIVVFAGHPQAGHGWAIPTATDIAFALAVLAVAGRGLPAGIRMFLLTLAVVDDLLGIVVIAVFYTGELHLPALVLSFAGLATFWLFTRRTWARWWVLLPVALLTWAAVHAAGVPPAVAGALLGLVVPVRPLRGEHKGRAPQYEDALRPAASWVALPIFAFCAAGVPLSPDDGDPAAGAVMVAVVVGLVVGKPLGVLAATWLATRVGQLKLPPGVRMADITPVGLLAGVGFTVALLVGHLSFHEPTLTQAATRGVLGGSALACLGAVAGLLLSTRRHRRAKTLRMVAESQRSTDTHDNDEPHVERDNDPDDGPRGNGEHA